MQYFSKAFLNLKEKIRLAQFNQYNFIIKPLLATEWKGRIVANATQDFNYTTDQLSTLHLAIKGIGATAEMDDFDRRKLGIFNELNFFQLIIGFVMPLVSMLDAKGFPALNWLAVLSLPIINITVLLLNGHHKNEAALVFYFIACPVLTSFVCMNGFGMGIELYFILYGILSVFFIQEITQMLFSLGLSMISYFMLAVLWSDLRFKLEGTHTILYTFNQLAGIVFIFYGLWLIKKENLGYQTKILEKNKEIAAKTVLLEVQTTDLTELNALKNKLFSVIAHDLKTPMYSLRNIFRTIQVEKLPAKDIKGMIPDVINNLNYTTGLLENLLQWAKSQMKAGAVNKQTLDLSSIILETIQLQLLPANEKKLRVELIENTLEKVMADKNMIELVLRNLLSNAIKFTPMGGLITIGVVERNNFLQVYVKDSGIGMNKSTLLKIDAADYYSTNGTSHEPGTGLGLMLCKDFLLKNNSALEITSEPGKGSTFSFLLEKA